MTIVLQSRNVWRISFAVLAAVAVALFLRFILEDGGNVIFTVLMSWFAAIAMAPAVNRMSRKMPRGVATILVMISFAIFVILFTIAFGQLLLDQIVGLIQSLPGLVDSTIAWVNQQFNLELDQEAILESIGISTENLAEVAQEVGGQAIGILGSVLGGVFSVFTFGLFTFYLSADAPRFRRWLATLFPPRAQSVVINVWDITAEKTGGYISARVILAFLNGSTTAIVFLIIGMPNWLALSIWTGIVAQFVPTIGTYIAITLPVLVGLLSDEPIVGVLALIWGIAYQQVENLTFEPKISAKAVNVHPAVAFGSVMMGAALFGVAGAFLAVPVSAMLLSLLNIYTHRYELQGEGGRIADRAPPDSEQLEPAVSAD
ncbi:MAG: AI-2E family transporter [Actinomycetia bacterium]|nr:AI-2E family transporter [Actinomycetes bacterium]MCH9802081.1 AI-2E family transporter [Actinomycetes bacterium]